MSEIFNKHIALSIIGGLAMTVGGCAPAKDGRCTLQILPRSNSEQLARYKIETIIGGKKKESTTTRPYKPFEKFELLLTGEGTVPEVVTVYEKSGQCTIWFTDMHQSNEDRPRR